MNVVPSTGGTASSRGRALGTGTAGRLASRCSSPGPLARDLATGVEGIEDSTRGRGPPFERRAPRCSASPTCRRARAAQLAQPLSHAAARDGSAGVLWSVAEDRDSVGTQWPQQIRLIEAPPSARSARPCHPEKQTRRPRPAIGAFAEDFFYPNLSRAKHAMQSGTAMRQHTTLTASAACAPLSSLSLHITSRAQDRRLDASRHLSFRRTSLLLGSAHTPQNRTVALRVEAREAFRSNIVTPTQPQTPSRDSTHPISSRTGPVRIPI